jgi:hypothetical protein
MALQFPIQLLVLKNGIDLPCFQLKQVHRHRVNRAVQVSNNDFPVNSKLLVGRKG